MKNFTKTFSAVLSVLFVFAMLIGFKPVQAASAPALNFVGYEHSPLIAGETEGFYLSASGYATDANVQYKLWVNKVGTDTWTAMGDYSSAVKASEVTKVLPDYKYAAGLYQVSVWVKSADTTGLHSNSNGGYDAAYLVNMNCVAPDSTKRVVANDVLDLSGTIAANSKVTLNGIKGISGVSASGKYLYKLHVYDVAAGTWTLDTEAYGANKTWTPTKNGQYVLDVWGVTAENPTVREVIRLQTVTVGGTVTPVGNTVLKTVVSAATFGSNVTVSLVGTDYPTVAKYQVYSAAGKPVSSVAAIGATTTVFPAVKTGDAATIKLLDASGKEILSQNVTLGTDVTLPGTTPVVTPGTSTKATIVSQVAAATFGSNVTVTVNGYADATQYQVYSAAGKPVSSVATLGKATTVFPAVKAGDKATVKLFDSSNKELTSQDVTLGTDAQFDAPGSATTTTPAATQTGTVAATVSSATFGSNVTVTATGYTSAANFQVYNAAGKPISSSAAIGATTTVFPAVKAGDTVSVKILDASGAVLDTQSVTLK